MKLLDIKPSADVGKALDFLLELREAWSARKRTRYRRINELVEI
jgi:hypothetical protein